MGERTFTEFKDNLKFILGNRDDLDSYLGNWVNDSYINLCSRNKFWKFRVPKTFGFPELDTVKTETGNDGDTYISKPTGVLFVHTVWDMTSDNILGYKDHSWYTEQTGRADSNSEAEPNYWIPYGSKLYLYPTLDDEYNFTVYYRKKPALLSGASETTIIGAEWDLPIEMLSTIQSLMRIREFDKAKQWREEFILTIQDLMGMQERQARYTRDRLIPSAMQTQKPVY